MLIQCLLYFIWHIVSSRLSDHLQFLLATQKYKDVLLERGKLTVIDIGQVEFNRRQGITNKYHYKIIK